MNSSQKTCFIASKLPHQKLESLKDLVSDIEEQPFKQQQNIAHEFLCFIPYQKQKPKIFVFENNIQGILEIFADQLIELIMKEFKTNQNLTNDKNQIKLSEAIFQLVQKPEFQLMIPEKDSPLVGCSQEALKDIILQFVIQAGNHSLTSTANSLIRKYPLIISIFVCMLRELLALGDICQNYNDELNMEQAYDFLASYFGIDVYIDIQNNSSYFPLMGTYVLQKTPSLVYMARTDNFENQKKRRTSLISNQQNQNEDYSQIDVQEFSNILNSKQGDDINGEDNEINVVVSNIDIGGEQLREINQIQSTYKIAESEIIINHFQAQQQEKIENQQKDQNKNKKENLVKESITTTLSSFRKKSSSLCKNTIKDYLQSQSVLKSQLFDTKRFDQERNESQQEAFLKKNQSVVLKMNTPNKIYEEYKFQKQNNAYFVNPDIAKSEVKVVRNQMQKKEQQNKGNCFNQFYENTSETFYNSTFSNSFATKKQELEIFFTPKFKSAQVNNMPEGQPSKIKTRVVPWINKNITKQFTSSFILMSIPQPFRSSIETKKTKARLERKNICNSFNLFV